MKPGDQFLLLFELDRPVKNGDYIHGIPYEGNNTGDHLWWAKPSHYSQQSKCEVVVCLDEVLTPELPPIPPGLTGLNFKT